MKWSDVDEKWISKNKENLFLYFKEVTIPKFYTSKVLDIFNNLTIDDVEITGAGNSTYGTVKIRIKSGNHDQVTYYILYSHWRSSEWEGHYDNLEDYTSEFLISQRDKKLGELLGH
jgi:hypothetical protein